MELGTCTDILTETSLTHLLSLSMDVGVDTHDFHPWHFDEISLLMAQKARVRSELYAGSPTNSP
jgi:hypothetical protein